MTRALNEGGTQAMWLTKRKAGTALVVAAGLLVHQPRRRRPDAPAEQTRSDAGELRRSCTRSSGRTTTSGGTSRSSG